MPQSPLTQTEIQQLQNQLATQLNNHTSSTNVETPIITPPVPPLQLSGCLESQAPEQLTILPKVRNTAIPNPQYMK